MVFHPNQKQVASPKLHINEVEIEQVKEFNFLGIVINEQLNWKSHIEHMSCNISRTNGILNRLKPTSPHQTCTIHLIGPISYQLWNTSIGS